MEFIQISDINDPRFAAAMEIYLGCFPDNERHPLETIKERVAKGLNLLYTDHQGAFIALIWPLKNTEFILLDYMATHPAFRGQQIGSRFLQYIHAETKKHLIIEAEHPDYGDDSKKRIAFYKKNGAKMLKNVHYILPGLQGGAPTNMVLMIFPHYNNGTIPGELVNKLITQIYLELYNLPHRPSEDGLRQIDLV